MKQIELWAATMPSSPLVGFAGGAGATDMSRSPEQVQAGVERHPEACLAGTGGRVSPFRRPAAPGGGGRQGPLRRTLPTYDTPARRVERWRRVVVGSPR